MQGPSRVGHGIGIDSTLVKRWKSSDLPIAAVRLGCGRPFWSHSLFDSWNSILEYSNYRTPTPPESRGRQSEEAGSTLSSDMPTYHWHAQQLGMWSLSQRRSVIMSLICHSTLLYIALCMVCAGNAPSLCRSGPLKIQGPHGHAWFGSGSEQDGTGPSSAVPRTVQPLPREGLHLDRSCAHMVHRQKLQSSSDAMAAVSVREMWKYAYR